MRYQQLFAVIGGVLAVVRALQHRKQIRWEFTQRFAAVTVALPRQPTTKRRLTPVSVVSRDDDEFLPNFRFTRQQMSLVIEAYALPNMIRTPRGITVSSWDAMGILLRRLALPGPWTVHVDFFGRRERNLREIFYITLKHMFTACRKRIQSPSASFLTTERLLRYSAAIRAKGGLYRFVFGFIDGTVYQICRPSGVTSWQRSVYSGHKKYHGFKWQGINTPDGLIQFMHGPFCAPQHDTTVLRESKVIEYMMSEFEVPPDAQVDGCPETHFSLFGDPGLAILAFLICNQS